LQHSSQTLARFRGGSWEKMGKGRDEKGRKGRKRRDGGTCLR